MAALYHLLKHFMLPLAQIDGNLAREGTIVDLGCGAGTMATALAEVPTRQVIGMDLDARRIARATRSNKRPNLTFFQQDITDLDLTRVQGVLLSDALHHVKPFSSHRRMLERLYTSLDEHGVLIIKDVDRSERIRTGLSMIWDRVLYPGDQTFYYDWRELTAMLQSVGFSVAMTRPMRFFPGSTTLYICRKTTTGVQPPGD